MFLVNMLFIIRFFFFYQVSLVCSIQFIKIYIECQHLARRCKDFYQEKAKFYCFFLFLFFLPKKVIYRPFFNFSLLNIFPKCFCLVKKKERKKWLIYNIIGSLLCAFLLSVFRTKVLRWLNVAESEQHFKLFLVNELFKNIYNPCRSVSDISDVNVMNCVQFKDKNTSNNFLSHSLLKLTCISCSNTNADIECP